MSDEASNLVDRAEKAEARVHDLEALIPHPGDGSCVVCGVTPAVHAVCDECRHACHRAEQAEARIRELEGDNRALQTELRQHQHPERGWSSAPMCRLLDRIEKLEARIGRQRAANRGMQRRLDERDQHIAQLESGSRRVIELIDACDEWANDIEESDDG